MNLKLKRAILHTTNIVFWEQKPRPKSEFVDLLFALSVSTPPHQLKLTDKAREPQFATLFKR
ncbi:MAG: hypothetical protein R3Y35_08980 [Clostridia bacterium]